MILVEAEPLTEFVVRAKAGQSDAWDALLRRYQLPLYTFVYELIHQEQASLDIVQETFIKAVRHIAKLREDSKFGSWLFGIAHQGVRQHRRTAGRRIEIEPETLDLLPSDEVEAGELLIQEEDKAALFDCLDRLPSARRTVLLLHFIEGFSLADIAGITDSQIGTVKSRLHYAKKSLRHLLKKTL